MSIYPHRKLLWFIVPLVLCVIAISYYSPPMDLSPEGYSSTIVAFEFANSNDDLHEVLDPLSIEQIQGLDMLNRVDFPFMIFYSLFLFSFLFVLYRQSPSQWIKWGMILCFFCFLWDVLENLQMFKLTHLYLNRNALEKFTVPQLELLHRYTWLKWTTIALVLYMIGVAVFKEHILTKILGGMLMIPLVLNIITGFLPTRFHIDLFTQSIFLGFTVLLLYCAFIKRPQQSSA